MKKMFLKALIVLAFLSRPVSVYADGMMFKEGLDYWELAAEDNQYCAISYSGGIQNMMLSIDPGNDFKGEKAVWLFPVPALPEETSINIFDKFPSYYGQDILIKARSSIAQSILNMRLYHYLSGSPLFFLGGQFYFKRGLQGGLKDSSEDIGGQFGVTVHEHMEKEGLTTELLSARTASGLYDYFKNKGLDFNLEARSILDGYIGSQYSFVATWISNLEQYRSREKTSDWREGRYGKPKTISVFISFPTEKMYFPLKPTSIYADAQIPIEIYVEGYVTPKLYPEIEGYVSVNYFHRSSHSRKTKEAALWKFLFGKSEFNKRYTKIKIQAPSSSFVDDMWMDRHTPRKVKMAEIVDARTLWADILTYLLMSCVASILAGVIVFREIPFPMKSLILVGLSNILTLLGFSVVAYRLKLNRDGDGAIIPNEISLKQCSKKVQLIALIIVALIAGGFFILIIMSLGLSNTLGIGEVLFLLIPILVLYAASYVFIFPFVWGMYNDQRSLIYIILFSVIFMGLTAMLEAGMASLL